MLDMYNSTNKHPAQVFDESAPNKILFEGTAKECMEYILKLEPENYLKKSYEINYK